MNRGSINEKHCSAEKVSGELSSTMSRDNTEKPQASSQRNKKEEKTPLAFLPSTCLVPIPAWHTTCPSSWTLPEVQLWDIMAKQLGEFSSSTLSSCTTPFSVCCGEIGNKLKTYLKEDLATRADPCLPQHPTHAENQARFSSWYFTLKWSYALRRGQQLLYCHVLLSTWTATYSTAYASHKFKQFTKAKLKKKTQDETSLNLE